jgi:murein DD-endopeptidase MepM/ murein hydrolase activator NlpD
MTRRRVLKNPVILTFIAGIILFITWIIWPSAEEPGEQWDAENGMTDSFFEEDEIPVEVIEEYAYGYQLSNYTIFEDNIKPGESLGNLLTQHKITFAEVDQIARMSREVFDLRRMAAGRPYTLLLENDSIGRAVAFIYCATPTAYVVYHFKDSLDVYEKEREIIIKEREASGVITSSLYETILEYDLSPALPGAISEIYAWTIDFFRIQKGDKFKVIFDERYVDGEFIGIGLIKAVMFEHANEEFYSFYFEENELFGDYFDEEGKTLRRVFLKAPVNFSRISSRYSGNRYHPVLKRWKSHLGTDYAAPRGTPIVSTANGTVIEAQYKKNNGNYVKIRHNRTYTTQYLHMTKIGKGIRKGTFVKQGQVIGYVGSTGLATGPHVCYRFWKNGKQVDPYKQKLPPSDPIKKENMERYKKHMNPFVERLENIKFK